MRTTSSRPKRWSVRGRLPADDLRAYPEIHPLIVQLLHNRGVSGRDEIDRFLRPEQFGSSDQPLADVERAVGRILAARDGGEKVAIHGDYDADGVTATVITWEEFRRLGISNPVVCIPLRQEGYGLNVDTIHRLAGQGVSLIVTVDCGVTAHREVALANQYGIDVIITDHHQIQHGLPPAYAVLHPALGVEDRHSYHQIAGSGVAMKLVNALRAASNGRPVWEDPAVMELVALGTVADVVPLTGENRRLVALGLTALRRTDRPGLLALCQAAGVNVATLDSSAIGFTLAPRLNAAGRLGDAKLSFELLASRDSDRVSAIAYELNELNRQRQQMTDEALAAAFDEIGSGVLQSATPDMPKAFVVAGPHYTAGVAGLVASKLVEEYYRPAVVIAIEGEIGRASARSISALDIVSAIGECHDLLLNHGGHPMAAGFTISSALVPDFARRFNEVVESRLDGFDLQETLVADAELRLDRFEPAAFEQISQLEPFGFGNPGPIFLSRDLSVRSADRVGRNGGLHLRLKLHDGRRSWTAMWFGHGELAESFKREGQAKIDLMFSFQPNVWQGMTELQLRVVDLRPVGLSD